MTDEGKEQGIEQRLHKDPMWKEHSADAEDNFLIKITNGKRC